MDASWVQFEGRDAHVKSWANCLMTPLPGRKGCLRDVPLIFPDPPRLAVSHGLAHLGRIPLRKRQCQFPPRLWVLAGSGGDPPQALHDNPHFDGETSYTGLVQ